MPGTRRNCSTEPAPFGRCRSVAAGSTRPREKASLRGCFFVWGRTAVLQTLSAGREQMLFTPQVFSVAPSGGVGLLGLLGRQGSGGFLPLWGGPPARFGDFPAVESHAGVRGRSAPKLPTDTLRRKPAAGGSWAKMSQRPGNSYRCPAYFPRPLQFPAVCAMLKRRNAPRLREEPLYVRFTYP